MRHSKGADVQMTHDKENFIHSLDWDASYKCDWIGLGGYSALGRYKAVLTT